MRIEELKQDLYTGDFGEYFVDYDNGYICDIISEIADNHTDFYSDDLLDWAKGNYEYIEEAIDEMGMATDGRGHADIIRTIQAGQFLKNEHDLYGNLEDSLQFFMYDYIEKELKIDKLTEEQNDDLLDWDFTDNNEQLENLIEHINEILKEEE